MSEFISADGDSGELINFDTLVSGDSELKESYMNFSNQRNNLYDWLEEKAVEFPPAYSLAGKVGRYISLASEAFANTSLSIKRVVQDDTIIKQYLTQMFLDDDNERITRFTNIVAQPELQQLTKEQAAMIISTHLNAAEVDEQLSVGLRNQYFHNTKEDVELLLLAVQQHRDQGMQRLATEMPLSSPESVHIEADPDYLKQLSLEYGRFALRSYF